MSKKLYFYPYEKPSVKIVWVIFALLFSSIILFSPDQSFIMPARLFVALSAGVFPFLFVYLILYWSTAADKKSIVRFIKLKEKNLEIIFRDKSVKIYPVENISSISISYEGRLFPLSWGPPRWSDVSIGIKALGFETSQLSACEFSTMVWASAIELVKYAKENNIKIFYNSDETGNYFEKLCR